MTKREHTKRLIEENRLIVIARGMEPVRMLDAAEALYAGGVTLENIPLFQKSGVSGFGTAA